MMLPLSRTVGNEHQEIVDLLLKRVYHIHRHKKLYALYQDNLQDLLDLNGI